MVRSFFEHVVDQYPEEQRLAKYGYWQKLRSAQQDYDREVGDFSTDKFNLWLRDRWGLEVEMVDGDYSPYYNVIDEKKYLLFNIKYG